ncbi:hypothetical protein [Treponema endosymbiont of Eucomonympha sp.]|uniref:hypothetical protein n=1 Tax=Treponema endosymbiont of Eucomonympha sp. TaxID=1580831 RepID=UPI00165041D5|nr:hypothetical protein [Treponema endosymbiont of Eucomonympha sp.]
MLGVSAQVATEQSHRYARLAVYQGSRPKDDPYFQRREYKHTSLSFPIKLGVTFR